MGTVVSAPADRPVLDPSLPPEQVRAEFEAFAKRYRGSLYHLAIGILRDPVEAEDVVQESFLCAWKALPTMHGHAAAWLHRICANCCLMRLRKRSTERVALQTQIGMGVGAPESAEPEALDGELRDAIEHAMAALPSSARAIFLLREADHQTYWQIARLLGASIPAVKSRLHRARIAIRHSIELFYSERRGGRLGLLEPKVLDRAAVHDLLLGKRD